MNKLKLVTLGMIVAVLGAVVFFIDTVLWISRNNQQGC